MSTSLSKKPELKLANHQSRLPVIIGLLLAAISLPAFAQRPQLRRPEEQTEEKPPAPPKPKKVKGPRAVALLQTSSDGKTSLIPIAILVEGKFYDASEYKADPVPMALYSGTVYEAEQAGTSQGLFTVSQALHSKSPANPHPWIGTGSYLANGTQAATNFRKAEDTPVGINSIGSTVSSGDAPPRLTRANESAPPTSAPAPAPASPPPAKPGASDKPADTSSTPQGQQSKPSTPASSSPEKTGAAQSSQPQSSDSSQKQPAQDANYYRPTLRRGKPTEQLPPGEQDEQDLTPAKPASSAAAPAAKAVTYRYVPAISDDGGPNPRSFKFFWKTGEEDERRAQMLALAATEVNAYLAARRKNSIAATPAPAKPASARAPSRKSPAKSPQPVFENVKFAGFDLWSNNQPVMVLTADAHLPPPAGSEAAEPPLIYSITLVARTDIYGELRKLYIGVTDKFHLDVTPRLQLIDVVDADGDGHGELLFSETTDGGPGYIIYRATPDKLWKLFDSQEQS